MARLLQFNTPDNSAEDDGAHRSQYICSMLNPNKNVSPDVKRNMEIEYAPAESGYG